MDLPLVSIIIPLFNAERFISDTLHSVLNQTYNNIEIIVVNDGSTDHSHTIVQEFEHKKISLYYQENKGASAARNFGLSVASGKYIQFLDCDDLLSENKIETQVALLETTNHYLATCACVNFMDGDNPLLENPKHEWIKEGSNDPIDFLTKLYGGSIIGPEYGGMVALHTWLIPTKIINTAGLWNETLSLDDDGEFMCRVLLNSKGVKYTPEATVYYRQHQLHNNISSLISEAAYLSLLASAKLKMKHLLGVNDVNLTRSILSRYFFDISVAFYPKYPKLTKEAEDIGKFLDAKQKATPYKNFPLKQISSLIGWRKTKLLSLYKNSWKTRLL